MESFVSSTFAQLGIPADLANLLAQQGINSPFPIQVATLPDALAGRDICGKAPTGSGKTLAFALAMALRLDKSAKPRAPRGLVLVPTRELASQVQKELAPLARARGRTVAAVYGGTSYEPQRRALRQGVDILVACPGRLEDLIARRDVGLECVDLVVLDEADRMADMGFLPAVRRILDATRPDRQTLLFSATLDGDVDKVVRRYQRDPRRHEVVAPKSQAADVEHLFWHADRTARVRLTADLLRDHSSAIVFCRTKHGADRLVTQLSTAGVHAVAIHGNRSQGQRERALAAFSSGRVRALIATDVVARGIHVDDVPCIVHFDPPGDVKDYVHRSGRTGRAGATGTVVSLVAHDQVRSTRMLQRSLGFPDRIDRPAGSRTPAPAAPTAPVNPVRAGRPQRRRGGRPAHQR
ncbi:MAG: DEAD/DEAH box helicase [Actinomycetota bacterium]|nr:DEAD/DEAH box helicase [Actinomycetota bacterium]